MRVYIIGAGPGDPRLLTLRGAELIAACPVVLYTGSLVPREVLAHARPGARVTDSSGLTLDEILAIIVQARDAGHDVARVHTGDPVLFGSTAEQMRRMAELGIAYEIVPGVSSFTAAAAVLGRELTLPELGQTVILTRAEGRTPMPPSEQLEDLARHQATLALFLSITLLGDVTRALIPSYGADCPVAVVHKATWPDQQIVLGTLADIRDKVRAAGIRSQSMILVGRVLTATGFAESRLYAAEFTHRFRRGTRRAGEATAAEPAPSEATTASALDAGAPSAATAGSSSPAPVSPGAAAVSARDTFAPSAATAGSSSPPSEPPGAAAASTPNSVPPSAATAGSSSPPPVSPGAAAASAPGTVPPSAATAGSSSPPLAPPGAAAVSARDTFAPSAATAGSSSPPPAPSGAAAASTRDTVALPAATAGSSSPPSEPPGAIAASVRDTAPATATSGSRPPRRGTVYLVGAGPGDPDLLTVRARHLLEAADVVAHDALVSPAILALARPDAELIPVGRRHGGGPTSYRLHPAVIARAAAGQIVVRLKAGDPLIFGRGGEEAEELAAAGVPFEIVPGISAALGAAAYTGIPLTHRRCASDVTLATGHDVDGSHPSHTDWSAIARGTGTLVLYMAGKALAANLARLVAGGRVPTTPAAYIAAATTPEQRVVVGTLATLAELSPADPAAPALVIVGDVVALRDRLGWFSPGPLAGRRVLVGRARPGRSAIAAELRALGAEVIEAPEIEVAPPDNVGPPSAMVPGTTPSAVPPGAMQPSAMPPSATPSAMPPSAMPSPMPSSATLSAMRSTMPPSATLRAAIDAALARHAGSARLVLACAAGVDAVVAAAAQSGRAITTPVVAIGTEAAAALERHGLAPAVRIRGACREALAEHAAALTAGPLVLVTGDVGRERLYAELTALGATVETVAGYRTIARMPALPAPLDAIVLPSSSCARAVLAAPHGDALRDVPAIVMGPYTEAAARDAGMRSVTRAARDDITALVDATVTQLRAPAEPPRRPLPETPAKPSARGLVMVYTGQGKGKTTAALGMVFRALGRGMRVAVVQFIKGKWKTGERRFAETLPELTFLVMGKGFTWNSDDLSRDRAAAEAAWATAKQLIAGGGHAIVVLDEITYAINYGFVELSDVLAALRARPAHVHVVVTGRNAPAELCTLADLVTDMAAVKHPFEHGVAAQPGVDY